MLLETVCGHACHTCQTKTLLFPKCVLIDLGPKNLLHQILRIGAMDTHGAGVCSIGHLISRKIQKMGQKRRPTLSLNNAIITSHLLLLWITCIHAHVELCVQTTLCRLPCCRVRSKSYGVRPGFASIPLSQKLCSVEWMGKDANNFRVGCGSPGRLPLSADHFKAVRLSNLMDSIFCVGTNSFLPSARRCR